MNSAQIDYLLSLCRSFVSPRTNNGLVTGMVYDDKVMKANEIYNNLTIPYETFKSAMGLDELRFHYLTTTRTYMAGGAVLSWVTGEENGGDSDFYFTDPKALDGFELVVTQMFRFVSTHQTEYARSYFHPESYATLQAVDGMAREYDGMFKQLNGKPHEILKRFDIGVCRWAVDSESVYTTAATIREVLSRSIRLYDIWNQHITAHRVTKYIKKGYYPAETMLFLKGSKGLI